MTDAAHRGLSRIFPFIWSGCLPDRQTAPQTIQLFLIFNFSFLMALLHKKENKLYSPFPNS